jgi:hypothetical protein
MTQMLTIPHQHVTFACGEEGTIRATLTAMPDGSAHGHLAILSRHGARRYRAVSGRCGSLPGHGPSACIQLEELLSSPGFEEIVELTIESLPGTPAGGDRAAFVLERLPDGGEIARAEVMLRCEDARLVTSESA